MAKTLGYMITWTTYGSWLQGDKRRYVKDGQILLPNEALEEANVKLLTKDTVRLSYEQRKIVEKAIRYKANQFGQQIYALAVCARHVHLIAEYIPKPIGIIVQRYKSCAVRALRKDGIQGRVWTNGYDKRYCFDENTLKQKINYVNRHIHKNN
ncbi:MAG: transposase [Sedimentisphaerales bacterium]|nr:transposase [Sedimentisphaerales bacterium]